MLFEAMIGKTIGNYQITGELAVGGMGAVYRARHLHLPREVVIKSILLESFSASAQDQLKARFRREAYIQAQLDHHNIVRVYEFFETQDNYYLVMEYVPGVSLRELLDKQGVPNTAQAVYLFKQVLAAVEYAHNFTYVDEESNRYKGIIHRDINPANLLLDQNGRVKITDFGTVKLAGSSRLTQHGFHPGTIEYMSPEQLRGAEIDARSDIYSLGITFYEMLTGQLPFQRSEDGSDWEVRKGHMEMTPPSILKLNPDVPSQLASIVMKALRKEPGARYQSAARFIEALDGFKRSSEEKIRKSRKRKSRTAMKMKEQPPQPIIELDKDLFADRLESQLEFEGAVTIPIAPGESLDAGNDGFPVDRINQYRELSKTTGGEPRIPAVTRSATARHTKSGISKYNWILNAAVLTIVLTGSLAGVYYIWNGEKDNLHAAMTEPDPLSVIKTGVTDTNNPSAQGHPALVKAEELEKRENYTEALETYESFLWRNPDVEGAANISTKISEIRRFQALTEAGKMAVSGNRLIDAWQYYSEALQVKPESRTAKAAMAELENRMSRLNR